MTITQLKKAILNNTVGEVELNFLKTLDLNTNDNRLSAQNKDLLMVATQYKCLPVVQVFIDAGYDAALQFKALQSATQAGHQPVVEALSAAKKVEVAGSVPRVYKTAAKVREELTAKVNFILEKERKQAEQEKKEAKNLQLKKDLISKIKKGNGAFDEVALFSLQAILGLDLSDLHLPTPENQELFLVAARYGQMELIDMFIAQGADLNVRDAGGNTALILATNEKRSKIVGKLLEAGVDVNAKNNNGVTALHIAAKNDDKIIMNKLLTATDINVNIVDPSGYSLLMRAAAMGDFEEVKLLIDAGADVNVQAKDGNTALHMAIFKQDEKIIHELLKVENINKDLKNQHGETALIFALKEQYDDIALALVEAGASVKIRESGSLSNALMLALEYGCEKTVDKILSLPDFGIDAQAFYQKSVLYFAVKYASPEIVEKLIKAGANANVTHEEINKYNKRMSVGLLEVAAKRAAENADDGRIVEILMRAGADVQSSLQRSTDRSVRDILTNAQAKVQLEDKSVAMATLPLSKTPSTLFSGGRVSQDSASVQAADVQHSAPAGSIPKNNGG